MSRSLSINWKHKYLLPAGFVILFAVIGVIILFVSHAATPYAAIEAETGATGGATSTSDSKASGGSYLQFGTESGGTPCSSTTTTLVIYVCNGNFVNGQNQNVQLRGVDVTGTEDACIENSGFGWESLNSTTASAIAGWHANVVRIPLNEDCWLGINGAPAAYSGTAYQTAIKNWVSAINAAGMYAILDLHWSAPGSTEATQQWPMADADHSITFWSQVAAAYKSSPAVMFELFNEPYIGGYGANSSANWSCWLNGCSDSADAPASASDYNTAGVQPMVTAIRNTGASNVILLGSLSWSGDTCGGQTSAANCTMMNYLPTDPDNQLALNIHSYGTSGSSGNSYCDSTSCLGVVKTAAANHGLPIVATEIGDTDDGSSWITTFMDWADPNNVGYIGWAWQPGSGIYDLVTNDNGTCNGPEGCVFQTHFNCVYNNPGDVASQCD